MELPRQHPTRIRPRFQFSLADIFVATAFSAIAVLTGIYFCRVASATTAEWWYGETGKVALARCLAIASFSCVGGAVGAVLRNRLVGALIGFAIGIAIFGHWVPS